MGATTFAMTVMYMITTANNLGQLAPVDKAELPPGQTSVFFFNEESCNLTRGKMNNPQKYVCQAWRGQVSTEEKFGAAEPQQKINPSAYGMTPEGKIRTASDAPRPETAVIVSRASTIQLADGHYEPGFKWIEDLRKAATAIKEADKPYLEPRVEPAARQLRTAAPRPSAQKPEPFKALIDVVMLPFDFLTYPGRRDW
jgi:hypothetical protein